MFDLFLGKCILVRDPTFNGCGFRMIEKDNYDTPIVIEVRANSPAKRRYESFQRKTKDMFFFLILVV
jgi:hypothetical protein